MLSNADLRAMVLEFNPQESMIAVADDHTLQDMMHSALRTVHWWENAHNTNTQYHQDFPGYCVICKHKAKTAIS